MGRSLELKSLALKSLALKLLEPKLLKLKLLVMAVLITAMFVPALSADAVQQAATKLTFVNRTDRDIYLALYVDGNTSGWYNIAPNATWVYELRENVWHVGYYAEGRAAGRRTVYWQGGQMFRGWIHPTAPFDVDRLAGRRVDGRPAGSRQVGFRHIGLIREFDMEERITNFVATVTLVENPQTYNPGSSVAGVGE